jgi:hypothetical protein
VRKLACAVTLLVFCVGVAMADEIRAVITKVDGNNVTFAEVKGKERGEEKTLPVSDTVKVVKGKFNQDTKKLEAGDEISNGLKNEMFEKIGEKGMRATIITDEGNKKITEIRVGGGGRKKKQ